MSLKYASIPQIVTDGPAGRISERSHPGWQQKFPAHSRPAHTVSDSGAGPVGGCWKIYEDNWDPKQPPTFGFQHRGAWFKRVQQRDPVSAQLRWVTAGACLPVMVSS